MLYPSLSQPSVFFCLFAAGFACGFLFCIAKVVYSILKQKAFALHVGNFLSVIASAAVFYFVNLTVNYGQVRLFVLFAFVAGVCLQCFVISKVFGVLFKKWYNKFHGRAKEQKKT